MTKEEIMNALDARFNKARSAWERGVIQYAEELLDFFDGDELTKEDLLRGAKDWKEYSYGGLSFIYDSDICERLCTPSEAKRKRNGELQPNRQETWLDVQARALYQAAHLLIRINK
ncbi:hypothetical protein [Mitsuokella jalaludinii]|uniref:hypothetical protein n=1 Tax=Mitsuokella jalaludinii TaxID=187979 RepID=UPI003079B1C2